MKPSTLAKWLDDIRDACGFIIELTSGRTSEEFASNRLLRQAVERNLEIIGEALLRVERSDAALASQISDIRSIIGLRNRLAHGYDDIRVPRVWQIVTNDVPILQDTVTEILLSLPDQAVNEGLNMESSQSPRRCDGAHG